ncbi:MAG: tripartite tricarboxylate transporter permease [Burkholderiales bacterium]|nr:tripartite tricarboxylate transporter permease [Burkholderiales bacterium]
MAEIGYLFDGFGVALTPFNLMLMFVGVLLGVVIGVLPGLGGANGVAILLPLTFTMPPTSAIIMLSCIYWGRSSAAQSPRSFSTSRANRGRSRRRSTAIRWRSRAAPAPRSPPRSPRHS